MTQNTPPAYVAPQPLSQSDERLWATLIHVGGIIIGFISPLVGYLVLKDRSAFVREHAKTALNFQLTLIIAWIVAYILTIVTLGLLFFLPLAVWVLDVVFSIIAAVAANKGEPYKYPLTIPFIK
jgi:uncharacterized Tic20 family protein